MSDNTPTRTDWFETWKQRRREEGERLGKTPCLHSAHYYQEKRPDLIYSSPHLHWDFGNCGGWLDE